MPKRGQRQPYKVEFQYPDQPRASRIAKSTEWEAMKIAREVARRGAVAEAFHLDPDSGKRTELARYDEDAPPPEDDDDLL